MDCDSVYIPKQVNSCIAYGNVKFDSSCFSNFDQCSNFKPITKVVSTNSSPIDISNVEGPYVEQISSCTDNFDNSSCKSNSNNPCNPNPQWYYFKTDYDEIGQKICRNGKFA